MEEAPIIAMTLFMMCWMIPKRLRSFLMSRWERQSVMFNYRPNNACIINRLISLTQLKSSKLMENEAKKKKNTKAAKLEFLNF